MGEVTSLDEYRQKRQVAKCTPLSEDEKRYVIGCAKLQAIAARTFRQSLQIPPSIPDVIGSRDALIEEFICILATALYEIDESAWNVFAELILSKCIDNPGHYRSFASSQ